MTRVLTPLEQAVAVAFLDRPDLDLFDLCQTVKEATGRGNRHATPLVRDALRALRAKTGAKLAALINAGWRATPEDQAALRLALKASVAPAPTAPSRTSRP